MKWKKWRNFLKYFSRKRKKCFNLDKSMVAQIRIYETFHSCHHFHWKKCLTHNINMSISIEKPQHVWISRLHVGKHWRLKSGSMNKMLGRDKCGGMGACWITMIRIARTPCTFRHCIAVFGETRVGKQIAKPKISSHSVYQVICK